MADTLKTKTQLLTVDFVANAGTEAIGSQQFRNGVVSTFGCYGGLLTNGGTGVLTLVDSVYQTVVYAEAMASSDLTLDFAAGTITIPTGGDGVYDVSFCITIERETVVGGDEFFCKLLKNATELCTQAISIDADNQYGQISGRSCVSCVATDVLKVQIANIGGAQATYRGGVFVAKRIG